MKKLPLKPQGHIHARHAGQRVYQRHDIDLHLLPVGAE